MHDQMKQDRPCAERASQRVSTDLDQFDLKPYIRDIPDFPKPGILFKDITPLLSHPAAFRASIDQLAERFADSRIDLVAAAEARGFIFAAPLAMALDIGFIPIRKPGKLPYRTVAQQYDLEYGTDKLEMHSDALEPGPPYPAAGRRAGHRRHDACLLRPGSAVRR